MFLFEEKDAKLLCTASKDKLGVYKWTNPNPFKLENLIKLKLGHTLRIFMQMRDFASKLNLTKDPLGCLTNNIFEFLRKQTPDLLHNNRNCSPHFIRLHKSNLGQIKDISAAFPRAISN